MANIQFVGSSASRNESERQKALASGLYEDVSVITALPGERVTSTGERVLSSGATPQQIAAIQSRSPLDFIPDTSTLTSDLFKPTTDVTKLLQFLTPSQPYNISSLGGTDLSKLEPEEKAVQQQTELAQRLNLELLGRSGFEAQQRQTQDITGKQRAVTDLSSQLFQLKAEQAAIQGHAAEPNQTAAMLGAKQAEQNRQVAVKGLLVSAQLEAARGNLNLALDNISSAVNQRYQPIKDALEVLGANMTLFKDSPLYKASEAKRKRELDTVNNSEKIAFDIATDYLIDPDFINNAPASVRKEITDLVNQTSRPLTIQDKTRLASLYGRYKAKKETGVTLGGITADTVASRLISVGLPTGIITTGGQLTKGNKDKITSKGVPPSVVDDINQAILEGNTLEEIRQALAEGFSKDVGFGYLDTFMQTLQQEGEEGIENPFK